MGLPLCIAFSALLLTACGSSPTSTLLGDTGSSVPTTEILGTTPRDVVGVYWLGLPVLTVKGKASVRVVGVRFAHYPKAGISSPQFYRIQFAAVGNRAITLYDDEQFHKFGYRVDGPYLDTILRPGDPTSYGVAKITIDEPGTYRITDVIVRYAEPDGSTKTQTFHVRFLIGPKGAV